MTRLMLFSTTLLYETSFISHLEAILHYSPFQPANLPERPAFSALERGRLNVETMTAHRNGTDAVHLFLSLSLSLLHIA